MRHRENKVSNLEEGKKKGKSNEAECLEWMDVKLAGWRIPDSVDGI